MLDRQSGLWLSHSTPKFPAYRNKDFWPKNGNSNAQTFICVNFPYAQFKEIGRIIPSCLDQLWCFIYCVKVIRFNSQECSSSSSMLIHTTLRYLKLFLRSCGVSHRKAAFQEKHPGPAWPRWPPWWGVISPALQNMDALKMVSADK